MCEGDVKYLSCCRLSSKKRPRFMSCHLVFDSQTSLSTSVSICIYVSVLKLYLQLAAQHVHTRSSERFTIKARLPVTSFRPAFILTQPPTPNLLQFLFLLHQGQTLQSTYLSKLEPWKSFLALRTQHSLSKFCLLHPYTIFRKVFLKYLSPLFSTRYHSDPHHCHLTFG